MDVERVNFRIFGQRFTFDAWILSHLTAKAPMDTPPLPTTPSALFIPAAMGNPWARGFIPFFLRREIPGISPAQMDLFAVKFQRVSGNLGKVDEAAWFSSIGWVWLKLLDTLKASYSGGYPLYMQSRLFPIKQLQTFLGSYTELNMTPCSTPSRVTLNSATVKTRVNRRRSPKDLSSPIWPSGKRCSG